MRYTFQTDECMRITISLKKLLAATADAQLLPDSFTCVFKDAYKLFLRGRPKELGVAQFIFGVFLVFLWTMISVHEKNTPFLTITTSLSVLFLVSGVLSLAAGCSPLMHVVKLSFVFNVISLFFALALLILISIAAETFHYDNKTTFSKENNMLFGVKIVLCVLCASELVLASVLIFWQSKAVCKSHFNTLPMISIQQEV